MIDENFRIYIDKPKAAVYDFVITNYVQNHPRWDPQVQSTSLDKGGQLMLGSTGKEVRKSMGTHTFNFTVKELTDEHVTFDAVGGGAKFKGVWAVKPQGAGSELSITFNLDFGGFMGLFEPFMKGGIRKEMRGAGERIKQMVEAGA